MKKILALFLVLSCLIVNEILAFANSSYNLSNLDNESKSKIIRKSNERTPRKGCNNGSLK